MATLLTNSYIDGYLMSSENSVSQTPLFPSGTKTLFIQTTSPTGWTKLTDDDDCALRVVSGDVSSGGTEGFFTSFVSAKEISIDIDDHTLTTSEMPSHTHSGGPPFNIIPNDSYSNQHNRVYGSSWYCGSGISNSEGGDGSHYHEGAVEIDFSVSYVDAIMAEKD